jgi:hypothetical protein
MNTVSLGGLTVGLCLLTIQGIRWWTKENHKIGALVPYLLSVAYGMLAIYGIGAILGNLFHIALWGASGLGTLGLVYGVGGTSPDVTGHSRDTAGKDIVGASGHVLTAGGHVVVVLLTVVLVCLCIWAKGVPTWKVAMGATAGLCLGLVGSVAATAAVPLASAANGLGAFLPGSK